LLQEPEANVEPKEEGSSVLKFDRDIIGIVYKKRLKYIVVFTILGMVLAGVWAKVRIIPTWKGNCFVIRAPKNMSTPSEMPYLYQSFDLNTILETVRTRAVLNDVIKRLRLKAEADDLFKAIEVQRGNRSNVLKFSVTWRDRELAAQIANATAESFIQNNTRLQNSATLKIYNYYLQQRQDRVRLIQEYEDKYEQFRGQYGVISIPNETQAKFDQLKSVELKMIENNLKVNEMDTKIADLESKMAATPKESIRSWTFTETDEKKLLQLQKELELLRAKYTDSNPKIQKVLQEIRELSEKSKKNDPARNIPESVTWGPSGLIETYTVDRTRLEGEKQGSLTLNVQYQNKVNNLRADLENLTQVQRNFFELERLLQLNRDVLRIVEGRIAEAKMAMESNVSDYEIVEPAKAPSYPEGTKRKMLVMGFGIAIFLLGSILVLGNEILDFSIKSDLDFKSVIGIPMIGQLPNEDQVDKNIFYRNLQIILDNVIRKNTNKDQAVICIGSDIPETGKSFVINDMLKLLLSHRKRILYIDSVHSTPLEVEPFVLNRWLFHETDTFAIDQSDPLLHRAYFLADESIFHSVVEVPRVQELFTSIEGYDYIFWELFDCHYHVQLFSTISSASDMLIMVGRFKRSSRHIFKNVSEFIKQRGFKNIYGVLNYVHKDYFIEKF
jgi:uncharacterized protein involved in exopolysaccharide biosynthesis